MRKITSSELAARMQLHAKENNLFIFALMKSATVAIAGLALLTIVGRAYTGQTQYLLLFPFWVVSLMATILTYNATSVFSNLLAHSPDWGDVLIPFIKTPLEFMLFAVLWGTEIYPGVWHLWPVCFGAFALVSHLKLRHFMSVMSDEYYADDLQPLLARIRNQAIKVDMPSSLISAVVFLVVGIGVNILPKFNFVREITPQFLQWVYNYSSNWQIVLAVPAFLGMRQAIKTAGVGRRQIFDHLDEIQAPTASAPGQNVGAPSSEEAKAQAHGAASNGGGARAESGREATATK